MNDDHDHDRGLAHDLQTLARRRTARRDVLRWVAVVGLIPVVGCGDDASGSGGSGGAGGGSGTGGGSGSGGATGSGGSAATTSGGGTCSTIPEETAGPYPGDGTNGANALALAGIVRDDIRSSLDGASGVAEGIPLTVTLKLVDSGAGCASLAGYAIYLWHCDRDGNYSMYSAAVADENYLRGVQETAGDGTVTFTTIFPGCYSGRWPHMHFEIFASVEDASSGGNAIATSQLAMPEVACAEAYETAGYETSVGNLAQTSLESDNVFSDGSGSQVASVTGDPTGGYAATLTVAVAG